MLNYKLKFVKSATALALGASVITTAVVAADTTASAKTTYKVSKGKLVNANTKKTIKGYKSYKSVLYKDGKKFTGLYSNRYYKTGVKATGTYKNTYYVNGVKKVTTGTYAGAYYVKGVKKVTTGTYNKAYYVKGKKVVATGLYQSKYYVDGVLNVGPALFEGKLYDGSELNKGLKEFNGKTYFDADLANDTYKDANGVEKAYENGVEVGAKVKSVEAINAKQVKVTFNKSVDPASVLADVNVATTLKTGTTATVTPVGTTTANVFKSAKVEGKSVILTLTSELTGRNTVVIDGLKTTAGDSIAKYDEVVSFEADKTAPTVVSTEKLNASQYKVQFSEPLKSLGTASYKLADGTDVSSHVSNDFVDGNDSVIFTLDSAIAADKVITASFVGLQDQALNLANPNPVVLSFAKGGLDGTKPQVTSVQQTGTSQLTFMFSEELTAAPQVTVTPANGSAQTVTLVQDKDNKLKYTASLTSPLDGVNTVDFSASAFTDLSGETNVAYSKVFTFVKDTEEAKVSSAKVVKDADTNQYFLEVAFDKNVKLSTPTLSATGSYVKDYVTTSFSGTATPAFKTTNDSKVIRVALSSLLSSAHVEGAVYNLDLSFAGITTEAGEAVGTGSVNFTYVPDGAVANTTVLGAPTVEQGSTNDEVTVTFPGEVDGASATDISNYSIDGATIEKAVLSAATTGPTTTQVVTLKLKDGSNTFTGVRNITVKNVKALGSSKTMEDYKTNTVSLNENVDAKLLSATLKTAKTIEVAFDEPLNTLTATPFVVKSGDTTLTLDSTTPVSLSADKKVVTITLATAPTADQLKAGLTVSKGSTDVKDLVNNVTDFAPTAVQQ